MDARGERKRVAIACQGGGSHTAFTAGVLKKLLRTEELKRYEVVGLSGTSGGAVCALLAWHHLLRGARGRVYVRPRRVRLGRHRSHTTFLIMDKNPRLNFF